MNTGQLDDLSPEARIGCTRAIRGSCGAIVITGPTGQGKTALAAKLEAVARDSGFPIGLHGDLRTGDAVRELFSVARTTVTLGVLRGGESTGALQRMEQMVGSALPAIDVTVITVRLLPKLCVGCRVALVGGGFGRGAGCDACDRGYSGKVHIVEVLAVAPNSERPWSSGSLASDGLRQLASGAICREDYLAFVPDAERFLA